MPAARAKAIDTTAEWEGPYRYVVGLERQVDAPAYGMLDERVTFVEGYFNETLGDMPAEALALIHIDADAYDSVYDAVGAYDGCRRAVTSSSTTGTCPACARRPRLSRRAAATGAAPPLLRCRWTT